MNLKAMFFKRAALISAITSTFFLASCGVSGIHVPGVNKPVPKSSISGRPGSDGPVLVVKIDDTPEAHPQLGLAAADLVYIEQVEGGLTRLAAVFSSQIPPIIGPVRSARITDIDLLAQLGHVAFAYSGAQSKLRPVIAAANLQDLGAEHESSKIYSRDMTRNAPVNMVLNTGPLFAKIRESSFSISSAKNLGWSFGATESTGQTIISAHVSWPAGSYDVSWSSSEKRWLLSHQGSPNLDSAGYQLGASTFVIQKVVITPSIYHDKAGGVTPLSQTIGSGSGFILRDGRAIPALWSRTSAESGTQWQDTTGKEIAFAPGQIWIALTDQNPRFTQPNSPSASSSPTK
jgi:hypothetical protein